MAGEEAEGPDQPGRHGDEGSGAGRLPGRCQTRPTREPPRGAGPTRAARPGGRGATPNPLGDQTDQQGQQGQRPTHRAGKAQGGHPQGRCDPDASRAPAARAAPMAARRRGEGGPSPGAHPSEHQGTGGVDEAGGELPVPGLVRTRGGSGKQRPRRGRRAAVRRSRVHRARDPGHHHAEREAPRELRARAQAPEGTGSCDTKTASSRNRLPGVRAGPSTAMASTPPAAHRQRRAGRCPSSGIASARADRVGCSERAPAQPGA